MAMDDEFSDWLSSWASGAQAAPIDAETPAGQALMEQYTEHNARILEDTAALRAIALADKQAHVANVTAHTATMLTLRECLPVVACGVAIGLVGWGWRRTR